jgi:hypothetical protein
MRSPRKVQAPTNLVLDHPTSSHYQLSSSPREVSPSKKLKPDDMTYAQYLDFFKMILARFQTENM